MVFDDAEPRPARGAVMALLVREDLDLFSVEDLEERIQALEGEIARARAAIESKRSRKDAADALFNFRS